VLRLQLLPSRLNILTAKGQMRFHIESESSRRALQRVMARMCECRALRVLDMGLCSLQ